jgi:SAM-dependent methyltransferase
MATHALELLRTCYRGIDGFDIPSHDVRAVARSKGSSTYGELMPAATLRLFEALELDRDDVFYDLGAGVGKVVLLAAATTPVGRAIGVELARSRCDQAERAFAAARRAGLATGRRARIVHADLLDVDLDLDDATVAYTCSTAFSTRFMRKLTKRLATLPRLRLLASLQDLDPHPAFELLRVLRLDASWKRRTQVHLYRRVR